MTKGKTAVIILAAGLGTRMKSPRPKVMHPIAGRPMINHLLAGLADLAPERVAVVIGPGMEEVARAVAPRPTAIQKERLGTAHAVLAAREAVRDFSGDLFILYGDTPLITPATLDAMLRARRSPSDPAVVVLGFRPAAPGDYGRLILNDAGGLEAIVEAKDATPEQLAVGLCNSGVMCVDGSLLFGLLDRVGNANAKGEYYLTDIVALAAKEGRTAIVVEGSEDELLGINSRAELAAAEAVVQRHLRGRAMAEGATLIDPDTVWFSFDTQLGRDVVVEPGVFFGPGVTVGDNVTIHAFSHLEGTDVASGAKIGPFARLRPGAAIGTGARIGNFVEVKKSRIEEGAKVSHLSYIGDARIGRRANIGAGTITCNYDGFMKSVTDIGEDAFIGSNTALVAPVRIGDGAMIGAGSVIARDVAAHALALTRAPQKEMPDWAAAFRKRRAAEKAAAGKK